MPFSAVDSGVFATHMDLPDVIHGPVTFSGVGNQVKVDLNLDIPPNYACILQQKPVGGQGSVTKTYTAPGSYTAVFLPAPGTYTYSITAIIPAGTLAPLVEQVSGTYRWQSYTHDLPPPGAYRSGMATTDWGSVGGSSELEQVAFLDRFNLRTPAELTVTIEVPFASIIGVPNPPVGTVMVVLGAEEKTMPGTGTQAATLFAPSGGSKPEIVMLPATGAALSPVSFFYVMTISPPGALA